MAQRSIGWDPLGRTQTQQDARGYRTSFVYDVANQQVALLDANGGRNTTLYDMRGGVSAEQDALGAYTTYAYDPNGNRNKRTDARGVVTTYTHDALDRLYQEQYPGNARVSHNYDAIGWERSREDSAGITSCGPTRKLELGLAVYPTGERVTYTYDGVGTASGCRRRGTSAPPIPNEVC